RGSALRPLQRRGSRDLSACRRDGARLVRRALAVALALTTTSAVSAHAFDWKGMPSDEPVERTWKDLDAPASPEEMSALGVDADLAEMMRNRTAGPPTLLHGASADAPLGLQWPVEATASVGLVGQLRAELAKRGLVIFVADRSFGTGPDHVALVRAADPVDVVSKRVIPPGMKLEDWTARLREWQAKSPWDLVGVGKDWLEIEFREPPAKPDWWVEEITRIAPH